MTVEFETKAEQRAYELGRSHFGAAVYVAIETMARGFSQNPNLASTLRELYERLKPVYRGDE